MEDFKNNMVYLILLVIFMVVFCAALLAVYAGMISPNDPTTLNDCATQIVGNCIVK